MYAHYRTLARICQALHGTQNAWPRHLYKDLTGTAVGTSIAPRWAPGWAPRLTNGEASDIIREPAPATGIFPADKLDFCPASDRFRSPSLGYNISILGGSGLHVGPLYVAVSVIRVSLLSRISMLWGISVRINADSIVLVSRLSIIVVLSLLLWKVYSSNVLPSSHQFRMPFPCI